MNEKDNLEEQFRKEVLKNYKELSKDEIKKLIDEANSEINFMQKIDEIELPTDPYVVFTDGEIQLLYDKGEFYVISSVDSKKARQKKTKKEATDMYLNYFIKYELNPILDQRGKSKEIVKEKTKEKEPVVEQKEVMEEEKAPKTRIKDKNDVGAKEIEL